MQPTRDPDLLEILLPWAPAWLLVTLIVVAALFLATAVHCLVNFLLTRVLDPRFPTLKPIVDSTRTIRRYAILILTLSLLMPLAPLTVTADDIVRRTLLAGFIVFIGWLLVVSVNIGLEFYGRSLHINSVDNLAARKAITQVRVLKRAIDIFVMVVAVGLALMSFDSVRQFGVSIFASAGLAGIAAGLAARPLLGNLVAGMQIAITQPIRLGDVLIIQGNWGTVEEITSTYVVLKIWDLRRLIVPLSFFFDNPFENWTRTSSDLLGTVMIYVDYRVPVPKVREKLLQILKQSPLWDGKVAALQVTDANKDVIELRALVSTRNSADGWDLRCEVREKLIGFLHNEYPDALPRRRAELSNLEDLQRFAKKQVGNAAVIGSPPH
jgi:small-conductance mechanosensitive channel